MSSVETVTAFTERVWADVKNPTSNSLGRPYVYGMPASALRLEDPYQRIADTARPDGFRLNDESGPLHRRPRDRSSIRCDIRSHEFHTLFQRQCHPFVQCGTVYLDLMASVRLARSPPGGRVVNAREIVLVGTGVAAVTKTRFARQTFAFICGASVLAIAPGLPMEFEQSFAIAMISTVECFTKAACVLAFGVLSSRAKQSRQQ